MHFIRGTIMTAYSSGHTSPAPKIILFLDDWKYYPTAVPDYTTTNESFLKTAKVYKNMGIKNYFFHLALVDQGLRGVDPFDPNLTTEMMARIGTECKINPWYFFREVLRIKPQASRNPIRFRGNRGNLGLYWMFFNHIDTILIQPRQTGKSVGSDSLTIYLMFVGAENTRINMLTKDNKLRKQNIERLKSMRDYLPAYLNHHNPREDADNQEILTCKVFGNEYSTAVPRNNEVDAENLGRGTTAAISMIDEPPFIPHINITMPAMLAAAGAARDEAKQMGTFYGNVFTTTAGKKDTTSGAYIYKMLQGGMVLDERALYDAMNGAEARAIVEANSSGDKPILNMTMSHLQLGYDDDWLREKMRDANSVGEAAERDYLNRWTSGGLHSPFSTALAELIRNSEKEPAYTEVTKQRYNIRWYVPEHLISARMAASTYTIGLDTSEGYNTSDGIAMVVIDNSNLEIIAAVNARETNIITFAEFMTEFLIKHKTCTLIPERRSTGITIIDMLTLKLPAAGEDPFKRIYNTVIDENLHRSEHVDYKQVLLDPNKRPYGFAEKLKKRFGFATSGSGIHSRSALYVETFPRAINLSYAWVNDKRLIDELLSLVVKNERIDHPDGGHDDMVVAWLLACWFLTKGRNLEWYGVRNALSNLREYNEEGGVHQQEEETPYKMYMQQEQRELKEEMRTLIEQLRTERDPYVQMRLEAQLRSIYYRVEDSDSVSGATTLNDLIRDLEEQRRNVAIDRRMNPNIPNSAQPGRYYDQVQRAYQNATQQYNSMNQQFNRFNRVTYRVV